MLHQLGMHHCRFSQKINRTNLNRTRPGKGGDRTKESKRRKCSTCHQTALYQNLIEIKISKV